MTYYPIFQFPIRATIFNFDDNGNLISEDTTKDRDTDTESRQYCSTAEFSELSGLAVQTIYNYRKKGIFVEGVHYHRPNNGKLMFDRAAIIEWIEQKQLSSSDTTPGNQEEDPAKKNKANSLINI